MEPFRKATILFKFISLFLFITLINSALFFCIFQNKQYSCAQIVNLPVALSTLSKINIKVDQPPLSFPVIRGLEFVETDLNQITFYFDSMDKKRVKEEDVNRMVKYFLGFLTIPNEMLWVNLSPYEKDKIVPESLEKLDIGKDMLLQDYLLKKLTSAIISPKNVYGKKFWQRVYQTTEAIAGTKRVSIETSYKVWVVPDTVELYEGDSSVFIKNAKLKVMLEQDYLGLKSKSKTKNKINQINKEAEKIFRQELLPIIQRQINNSGDFAPLRQMYYTLILANYFKNRFSNHSVYSRYINAQQGSSIALNSPEKNTKNIYQAYLESLKSSRCQLSFNQYYSGGIKFSQRFNCLGKTLNNRALQWVKSRFFKGKKMQVVKVEFEQDKTHSKIYRIYDIDGTITKPGNDLWYLVSRELYGDEQKFEAAVKEWKDRMKKSKDYVKSASHYMMFTALWTASLEYELSGEAVKSIAKKNTLSLLKKGQVFLEAIEHIKQSIEEGYQVVFSTTNYQDAAEGFLQGLIEAGLIEDRLAKKIIVSGSIIDWQHRSIHHFNMVEGKIIGICNILGITREELVAQTDSSYGDDPQGNDQSLLELGEAYVIPNDKNRELVLSNNMQRIGWQQICQQHFPDKENGSGVVLPGGIDFSLRVLEQGFVSKKVKQRVTVDFSYSLISNKIEDNRVGARF